MGSVQRTSAGILALSYSLVWVTGVQAAPPPRRPAGNQQVVKKGCDLSPQYNAYVGRLQNKVLNKWNTLLADGKNNVTLAATVAVDGSVTNVTVRSTPSNPQAEQAALDAFNNSQPLEALPSGSQPVIITFNFISTSDPHGDSNSSMSCRLAPVTAPSAAAPPSSSSSSYTPPSSSYQPDTSSSSTTGSSGGSYPASGGMPSDLGLGSVLPPDKDGGQSAPAAQSATPTAAPETQVAPATAPAAPASETAAPSSAAPAAEAAPAAQAAPAQAVPASSEPAAAGKEAVSAPESAPSSTPVGGGTQPANTGAGDDFTQSSDPAPAPTGSGGGTATYGSPETP